MIKELTRRGTLLDLVLTNKEVLVWDVKAGYSFGCSNHKMMEFRILRKGNNANNRITVPDFRRLQFEPFRDLLGRIPWEMVLERRRVQESWLVFKDYLFQSQEWSIPISRKSNKGGRRPTPKTKMLLTKLKCKNKAYKRWKQDHGAQEEYKDTV